MFGVGKEIYLLNKHIHCNGKPCIANSITTCCQQYYNMLPTALQHVANSITTCCQQYYNMLPTALQHVANSITTCYQQHYNMLPTALQHVANRITTCCQQYYNMLSPLLQHVADNITTTNNCINNNVQASIFKQVHGSKSPCFIFVLLKYPLVNGDSKDNKTYVKRLMSTIYQPGSLLPFCIVCSL